MKKRLIEKWHVIVYIVFLIISILMVISTMISKKNYQIEEYSDIPFEHEWQYEYGNGVSGTTKIPGKIQKTDSNELWLTNTLPKIEHTVSLVYRARHANVRIYLDGIEVYDDIEEHADVKSWFPLTGNIYTEIVLDEEDSGKQISIESHCESSRYLAGIGECYIGDRGSFFLHILKSRSVMIICALTLFIMAFFLFFIWFILRFFAKVRFWEGLCLALFTMGLALWMLTETQCIQFIAKDTKFVTVLAFEILILLPVPIALFFYFTGQDEKTKKMSKVASVLPLALWGINNLLHIFEIVQLQDSLIVTQSMILLETGFVSFIQIRELVKMRDEQDAGLGHYWRIPVVGICVLFPMASIETIRYMLDGGSSWNDGVFITIGFMIYIMSLALASAMQLSYKSFRLQMETETKSQFLANMSHEIRTPLNAILGYGEMILRETHEDKVRNYAVNIQNAGDNLRDIINSILDITKIEAGKLEIYSVEYSTVQLIDNIISVTEALAEKKGLQFIADIDENLPSVMIGDETHIRQIIMNLTNNAVKYTKKGTVTFSVKLLEVEEDSPICRIYVSVKDTGIGIKEEDKQKLFEKFERLDQGENYNVEGTGLGMSIVVSLLSAMDSHIELDSVYGKGSDFHFVLTQCAVGQDRIGSFQDRRNEMVSQRIENADFIAPDARILVVDDLEMNLNVACDLLEPQQMQIDKAKSGQEAIDLVQKNHYDMILMDHMMPGMDGIQATQKIRDLAMEKQDAYYAMVPILALTAMVGMKDSFIQAGMQDFISKPVEINQMIHAIKKWLPKDKIRKIQHENVAQVETPKAQEWEIGEIEHFDMAVAKQYNVSQQMFERNLKDFYDSIEATREKILEYRATNDAQNYQVSVHGLKSVSKIIGAMELSQKALELETLCIDGKFDEAAQRTEELLAIYQEYENVLRSFLQIEEAELGKTVFTEEEYQEFLDRVKEAAESFDMGVFMELEAVFDEKIPPEGAQEQFEAIREGVKNASFMDVAELLAER